MPDFMNTVKNYMPGGLTCEKIRQIQVNLGRRCNLSCTHCHLECAPERTEEMDPATMEKVVELAAGGYGGDGPVELVDITGGSPELHPHFQSFIRTLRQMQIPVQVRTNFAALLEPGQESTMAFLKDHQVRLVGSMPCYLEENVRSQRGAGTYEKNIWALERLNRLGYGREEDLLLNMVYNPGGAFLPGSQAELENDYKEALFRQFGIVFNHLLVLTNMPIGRFGHALANQGESGPYVDELAGAFNPETLDGLMCRHQISIDHDGRLYDCDFNIALQMPVESEDTPDINHIDLSKLEGRPVAVDNHCFGCTAGAGSSCGGALAGISSHKR
ncbi:MAG: arsenosugar biosynthesis radical SAM (seleno)protein ArsS [Desulfobacterales bacterium]